MEKKNSGTKPLQDEIRSDREKAAPFLEEGDTLLASRRFEDAIDLYREGAKIDRRNPEFFTRIGIACLFLDYLDDAEKYFNRALALDRDHEEARNGLTFVYMKTDRVPDATELLCDVIKRNPGNRAAKYNFERIRNAESLEQLLIRIHPEDFVRLPKKSRVKLSDRSSRRLRFISVFIISFGIIVLFARFGPQMCSKPPINIPWGRSGRVRDYRYPGSIPLNTDIGRRLRRAVNTKYDTSGQILADGEGGQMVARIKGLMDNREYNESRFVFNRLVTSNPDEITLTMASNLARFLRDPDADSLKFNPRASEIADRPWLYSGIHVKWFGRAVMRTNGVFLQVAPARYHNGKRDNIDVIVIARDLPAYIRNTKVDIFGEVIGVDKQGEGKRDLVFLKLKKMKQF